MTSRRGGIWGGTNRKGYQRDDFEDAFRRYLDAPPFSPGRATSATSATDLSNKDKLVAPVAPVAPVDKKGANGVEHPHFGKIPRSSKADVVRLTAELMDAMNTKGDAA